MYGYNTNHTQILEIIKKNIFPHTFCMLKNCWEKFSSDLRKPCLITGKSLSPPTKLDPVHEKITYYITKTGWEVFPYSLQMFLMTPLCIHHHSPPCCIWICRWCHSSMWCGLCLWEPSDSFWWYFLLCNVLAPHVCCRHSLYFHWALLHMVVPYMVSGFLMYPLYRCYSFSFVLVLRVPWSSSLPCSGPNGVFVFN